jgi:hypothetical protein
MAVAKKVKEAGAKAGKKVLATDAAQSLVGTVVDKLERLVVDNADDVAVEVKKKAAKAGGRSTRSVTSEKKSPSRKKTSSTSRKKTSSSKKKSSAKRPMRKTSAKK